MFKSFIESGSRIIETCSYQLSLDNLTDILGISKEEARTVIKKSVEIAILARLESKTGLL